MLESIGQLVVIVAGIIGGFGWLINFLEKKFKDMNQRFQNMEKKLDNKVTEELCKERRSHFPCGNTDGSFKCPVGSPSDQSLSIVLTHLTDVLEKLEKKD